MTLYLLDTNIISDVVRNPAGRIAREIERVGEDAVATSAIAAAEVRYGVAKKGSHRLAGQVEAVFASLAILPFEAPADEAFGRLRAELERNGQPIGAYDMLIAAHAHALGATLVTDNEREFRRVAGLEVVNWLR